MGRRDLSPEDLQLWHYVTRSVSPYHAPLHQSVYRESEPDLPPRAPAEAPHSQPRPARRSPPPLAVGIAVDMDRNTARRFKRGELPVDARIDLHGLTLDQAHSALGGFIRAAQGRGYRCVVVVTGKGSRGESDSPGKIRREMPHWLNQPALRPLVLAVTEARARDGGTGAFYVLLKRRR